MEQKQNEYYLNNLVLTNSISATTNYTHSMSNSTQPPLGYKTNVSKNCTGHVTVSILRLLNVYKPHPFLIKRAHFLGRSSDAIFY